MSSYIKKISLIVLAAVFLTVGWGTKEVNAICMIDPTSYSIPNPSLNEVIINGATTTNEGSLSASVSVPADYSEYLQLVFLDKSETEVSRVKIDGIKNMKLTKQTVTGIEGKEYTVVMKTGTITVNARSLPLALVDFIAQKDNYTVVLEASNFIPEQQVTTLFKSYITDTGCGNGTLTSVPQTIYAEAPVFPGYVNVNQDGTINISIQMKPAYANAKIYLVILDSRGIEIKRIVIDPKNTNLTASDLALPSGNYTIFIELTSAADTISSTPVTWTVPAGTSIPAVPVGSGYGTFPGGIEIGSDGSIRITIQAQSNDYTSRYYLVITDSNGKVVKRSAINPRNPKVTLNNSTLTSGSYTLELELVKGTTKVRSNPVTWVIPQPTLPIPSGADFPGTIFVNPDGTITVTVTSTSAVTSYTYYTVILDVNGNEIIRLKFDPTMPFTKTLTDLKLQTGGYYIVIEVVDQKTGGKAASAPTFTTYNGSQDIIVFIDGQLQTFDYSPVNVDGRTLVPLRAIFEALGAKVEWDAATRTVTGTLDDTKVVLTINSNVAWVNGNMVMLDVPAQLINETTMVPIRFVSEALGAEVKWDERSHSVIIQEKQ